MAIMKTLNRATILDTNTTKMASNATAVRTVHGNSSGAIHRTSSRSTRSKHNNALNPSSNYHDEKERTFSSSVVPYLRVHQQHGKHRRHAHYYITPHDDSNNEDKQQDQQGDKNIKDTNSHENKKDDSPVLAQQRQLMQEKNDDRDDDGFFPSDDGYKSEPLDWSRDSSDESDDFFRFENTFGKRAYMKWNEKHNDGQNVQKNNINTIIDNDPFSVQSELRDDDDDNDYHIEAILNSYDDDRTFVPTTTLAPTASEYQQGLMEENLYQSSFDNTVMSSSSSFSLVGIHHIGIALILTMMICAR